MVFKVVTSRKTQREVTLLMENIQEEFKGYILTQPLKVESTDVEKVDKVSRKVTELLNKGFNFILSHHDIIIPNWQI